MTTGGESDLDRALALLGPLEGRIMRAIWSGQVPDRFAVRDMHELMSDLAYTTVMTTLNRLAEKQLVEVEAVVGRRAYQYRSAGELSDFLAAASEREAARVVEQYGDNALAAFAARLDRLSPSQRRRLDDLRRQR